jgi:hypothetical protein
MRDYTFAVKSMPRGGVTGAICGPDIFDFFAPFGQSRYTRVMKDLLTITDPVRVSFIEALLKDAGIAYVIRDGHMADLLGQQNGLFPRRLAVNEDDAMQVERILKEADQFYDE